MSTHDRFPTTRYAGSKRKLLPTLEQAFKRLSFSSVQDPFCGTGAVSYLLKTAGKKVWANDYLQSNAAFATALLTTDTPLDPALLDHLVDGLPIQHAAPGFIETHFDGIYYPAAENRFLDQVRHRLFLLDPIQRHPLFWCLGQAALAKRPYNLFHRANLAMRTARVHRTFGNKTTWETPFPVLMHRFLREFNQAVFPADKPITVTCRPIEEIQFTADLVYLDPPYVSARGNGVDYGDHYHFLDGLLLSDEQWAARLLNKYKHRPIDIRGRSLWSRANTIYKAFEQTLARIGGKVVISYRSDGIPTLNELVKMVEKFGKRASVEIIKNYTYALSTNTKSEEAIIIGI